MMTKRWNVTVRHTTDRSPCRDIYPDLGNPYITGILTDSRGQNKDRKSQYRLEYTDVTEETAYEESAGAGIAESTRDLY